MIIKKYDGWISLCILSCIIIFAFTCQNHFWHPRALFFNTSSMLDLLYITVNHTAFTLYLVILTIIHQGVITFTSIGAEPTISLAILFYTILLIYHLFYHSKYVATILLRCTSEPLEYREYFLQNSRAIIPIP